MMSASWINTNSVNASNMHINSYKYTGTSTSTNTVKNARSDGCGTSSMADSNNKESAYTIICSNTVAQIGAKPTPSPLQNKDDDGCDYRKPLDKISRLVTEDEGKDEDEIEDEKGIKNITQDMLNFMIPKRSRSIHNSRDDDDINCSRSEESSEDSEAFVVPDMQDLKNHAEAFDKVWAKELYEIRHEDREAILNELHGVQSRAVPETPDLIESSLLAMEEELRHKVSLSLPSSDGQSSSLDVAARELVEAHVRATEVFHSQYVVAPEFRLRFLRTDFFDVRKAAIRYCKCLNHLLRFFGDASLRRPLRLSDLSPRELRFVNRGQIQSLASRDKMGRRIFLVSGGLFDKATIGLHERHRVELYLSWGVMAEDEATQLHGAVSVTFFSLGGQDNKTENQYSYTNKPIKTWNVEEEEVFRTMSCMKLQEKELYTQMVEAAPIRWSSIHLCKPDKRIYHFLKAIILGMIPSNYRAAARVHTGSHVECCYDLCQFGVPVEDIPTTVRGMLNSKCLVKFIRAREAIDNYRSQKAEEHGVEYHRSEADFCPGTDCPGPNCVVFGDRSTYNSIANETFRENLRERERRTAASAGEPTPDHANCAIAPAITKSKALLRLNAEVLDHIIDGLCMKPASARDDDDGDGDDDHLVAQTVGNNFVQQKGGRKCFRFAVYEKEVGWYRYIDPIRNRKDRIELRKRISQTMRDDRKRIVRKMNIQRQRFVSASSGASRDSPVPLQYLLPKRGRSSLISHPPAHSREIARSDGVL